MGIEGSVLKVLDSTRLIANVGSESGVDNSMKFVVYSSIDLGGRYDAIEIEKATLTPADIRDKMTIMKTESKWVEFDFSMLSNFYPSMTGRSIQEEMSVEDHIPDDVMIVREGDFIREVEDDEAPNTETQS